MPAVGLPTSAFFASPRLALDTGVAEGEHLLLHGGIRGFYGLPFAAPPIGDLRWQAPQQPKSWAPSVRNARKYGKSCIQHKNAFVDLSQMSEDCLYLNAWLPKEPPRAKDSGYPTMVFFYGGSWKEGSAMFPLYSGEHISSHHDVISLAVNYRLGSFGFLGSDRLRAIDGSTGNFGIQASASRLQHASDHRRLFLPPILPLTLPPLLPPLTLPGFPPSRLSGPARIPYLAQAQRSSPRS